MPERRQQRLQLQKLMSERKIGRMTQLSSELKQERRSRIESTRRIEDFGWLVDPIATDIGEDLLVRVLNGKQFSGITFFAQLKSRASIGARERQRKEYSQKIGVDHLIHWEASAVPVVIVVWDLCRNEGYWITVDDAIRALDANSPSYRSQKTVQVKIPFSNVTDDAGLKALRLDLAHRCLPSVQRGRSIPFDIAFDFAKTPQGRRQQRALKEAFAHGKRARIDGRFITRFQPTGWAGRLFGDTDRPAAVVIMPSVSKDRPTLPIRVESVDVNGQVLAAIPYVELRLKRQGEKTVTLANDDQPGTFGFEMTFPRKGGGDANVSYRVRPTRTTVNDVRNVVRFGESMSSSSRLRIVELRGGKAQDYPVTPRRGLSPAAVNLMEKLGEIQDRIDEHGTIQLARGMALTREQEREIHRLHTIVTTGRHSYSGSFTIGTKREAIPQIAQQLEAALASDQPPDLTVKRSEKNGSLNVFGVEVPFTAAQHTMTARISEADIARIRQLAASSTDEFVQLEFRPAVIEDEYHDFIRNLSQSV